MSTPFYRPLLCLVQLQSLGSCVKQPPLAHGSLITRKQGTFPAPFGCSVWQLIFFCRIRVCNPHFHVRIPLRPVLSSPAVQTGWLIKGILFVKQSSTFLSLPLSYSLSFFIIITYSHSPFLCHSFAVSLASGETLLRPKSAQFALYLH